MPLTQLSLEQALVESPSNLIGRVIRYKDWEDTELCDFLQIMDWLDIAFAYDIFLEGKYLLFIITGVKELN
ncbi:hypothetical protein [Mucilaginibacter lacusdianchii]|uniref:hypothetical protein n=1 Tax=Mucilaginibacter lacusdianchii TaxID=2684211 RepID=UPI00131B6B76|nr:hypothetical protein [Mucilaginibacter sp. JXJ CY 39]